MTEQAVKEIHNLSQMNGEKYWNNQLESYINLVVVILVD
jgi:hypothetical protein